MRAQPVPEVEGPAVLADEAEALHGLQGTEDGGALVVLAGPLVEGLGELVGALRHVLRVVDLDHPRGGEEVGYAREARARARVALVEHHAAAPRLVGRVAVGDLDGEPQGARVVLLETA
jgi:hypothetical protein